MYMSGELIAVIGLGVTMLTALAGGFGWVVHRIDRVESRIDRVDAKVDRVDARIDRVDARIDTLSDKIDALGGELTELKVEVARWTGPKSPFIAAR
ncbi:hypothetical protein DY023_04385 [Microbacterium bovistercoris]|uniref:Response regulator n=1 Tax=Microbacterium bovistercoris TaxID=2293570 RepID=A0A371NXV2_9MICO|nr:hypothetical protein [Microbacterium bovistercoris]REJ07233.1 hypothetical protein DY023_04385 [Microbacterium bovistercoris]